MMWHHGGDAAIPCECHGLLERQVACDAAFSQRIMPAVHWKQRQVRHEGCDFFPLA
jgi:hypothetical protein